MIPVIRLHQTGSTPACTSSPTETYTYDAAGNRTKTVISGTTTWYGYDAEGQLCKTGATSGLDCSPVNVTYDDIGRTKTWNGWTLTYEGEGRLATACKVAGCATGDKVTMRYDGEGRRVELVTRPNNQSPTTTTFRYQGSALAQELTNGTVSREYVTDEQGAIVKVCDPTCIAPTTSYLVTYNGHGDALALWRINSNDGSLTLANSFTYSTWGKPTTTVASGFTDLKFRFLYVGRQGVQWDDDFGLGLLYMQARHYSPAIGRFLQPDPAAMDANLYAYVLNNPVTDSDCAGTATQYCMVVALHMMIAEIVLRQRMHAIMLNKGIGNGSLPWAGKPGVTTVATHQEKFREWQRNAGKALAKWDKHCGGGNGPPLPPRGLSNLRELARMATPKPILAPPYNRTQPGKDWRRAIKYLTPWSIFFGILEQNVLKCVMNPWCSGPSVG